MQQNSRYQGQGENLRNTGSYQNENPELGRTQGAVQQRDKITINLEDAYLEEQKLYNILEALRRNNNASLNCDDWWDVTESGNFITTIAFSIIKDPVLRNVLMRAQKYETIAIGIV